jgi:HSP20 family protein
MSTIIRWNPLREMAAMQQAMDRLFDETWRNMRAGTFNGTNFLPVDVHETDTNYTVFAWLPGLSAEAINISLQDDVLTISGEFARPEVNDSTRILLEERPFGKFSRSINLPQAVDRDHVEATYENGVLTLSLPKSPEVQPRIIPVKAVKALESKN